MNRFHYTTIRGHELLFQSATSSFCGRGGGEGVGRRFEGLGLGAVAEGSRSLG